MVGENITIRYIIDVHSKKNNKMKAKLLKRIRERFVWFTTKEGRLGLVDKDFKIK